MFLAVLFALICVVPTSLAATEQGPVVPMLFLLSPVLYAALHLLTWWKETLSGTLEWKQTCRLSFGMMTALRMLVFGGAATLLCVPQCFLMWFVIGRKISFLFMLSVSFSSLFLYAALALALRKSRWGSFCPRFLACRGDCDAVLGKSIYNFAGGAVHCVLPSGGCCLRRGSFPT